MRTLAKCLTLVVCVFINAAAVFAQTGMADLPLGVEKTFTTVQGVTGLGYGLGSAEDYVVILRIAPLAPGAKYEATLTYDAGTEIGYGHAWVDGNPFGQDWASFVGIGTGTGSRELKDKKEKFIFSIDPNSTSNTLYLALRTNKTFTFRFVVSDRLSGVTPNSQDQWGYYYVTDFDISHNSPFLLKRGQAIVVPPTPPVPQGQWLEIPVNTEKTLTTVQGVNGLVSGFASPEDYVAVLRLSSLQPGVKYEATLTYDAGTEIGYGHAWVDGSPFQSGCQTFVGIGTGTGSRELKDKREKFIFTVDPKSTTGAMFLVMRTNKPLAFRFGVSDKLTGVTANSQDQWGYYYVTDFDASKNSPFLLVR